MSSEQKSRRRKATAKRTSRYSILTARQKAARERSLALLSDLRAGKAPYWKLLRQHHLHTRTAHKYLGRNLRGGTRRGEPVRPTKSDRLLRELLFPTPSGDLPVRTRSSRDATKLSAFFQDRDKLLRGKLSAQTFEAKWRGVRIGGQEVFADVTVILDMANAGDLKVENLYASTGGAQ
jgi:hypothetical protein